MKNILTILAVILSTTLVLGQKLTLDKEKSKMMIEGTSSIHDWESAVEAFDVQATLENEGIINIRFVVKSKSIKSGKSAMDKNTYKALKETDYPEITFDSDKLAIEGDKLSGTGNLSIAGKTNQIPVNLDFTNTSTLEVNGNINIKMTDFDIAPPTAVFGTIKTGDEITIKFNFNLIKN